MWVTTRDKTVAWEVHPCHHFAMHRPSTHLLHPPLQGRTVWRSSNQRVIIVMSSNQTMCIHLSLCQKTVLRKSTSLFREVLQSAVRGNHHTHPLPDKHMAMCLNRGSSTVRPMPAYHHLSHNSQPYQRNLHRNLRKWTVTLRPQSPQWPLPSRFRTI